MKRRSVAIDALLICIGAAAGLLTLLVLPGQHNLLDAKLAIALGAAGGYAVALLFKMLR